jgi:hypothetical protein
MFDTTIITTAPLDIVSPSPVIERPGWGVLALVETYPMVDIDEYRAKYGVAEGERRFYREHAPDRVLRRRGNLVLYGGASVLFECLMGNGGTGALSYFNNANAQIGVGDSTVAESYTQTDLQAAVNKSYKAMDATYPVHADNSGSSAGKTITNATNATPIVVTATSHGFANNDVVSITGVAGNTAANGIWQITYIDGNTFSLNSSSGNGAYTSGGLASKTNVIVFRSTFGTSDANYTWNEWVIRTSAGPRALNRKVASLGTKSSSTTQSLTVALALT